jgi:hypothetical protein
MKCLIILEQPWTRKKFVLPAEIKANAPGVHSTGKDHLMRRIYKYSITKESTEDMINAGRFNPCLEITYRDRSGKHTHKLSAGYSDDIDVYRDYLDTFILSRNSRLDYVGLEVFEGADKIGSIFLESHQVKEVLGREDLAPFNAIKRLLERIM